MNKKYIKKVEKSEINIWIVVYDFTVRTLQK